MLYHKPKSKFTCQSVCFLIAYFCLFSYVGLSTSLKMKESTYSHVRLPISMTGFIFSYSVMEPYLVKFLKHWMAHNQKTLFFLILSLDLVSEYFMRKYKIEPILHSVLTSLFIGIIVRQMIQPLWPQYFSDRGEMVRNV